MLVDGQQKYSVTKSSHNTISLQQSSLFASRGEKIAEKEKKKDSGYPCWHNIRSRSHFQFFPLSAWKSGGDASQAPQNCRRDWIESSNRTLRPFLLQSGSFHFLTQFPLLDYQPVLLSHSLITKLFIPSAISVFLKYFFIITVSSLQLNI